MMAGQLIVAGVDGSPSARGAALWAAAEAQRRVLPVRLVHSVAVSAFAYTGGIGMSDGYFEDLEDAGQQALAEAEAVVHERYPDVVVQAELRHADVAPALIEQSRAARLLVLGSRGLGGVAGMVAGSTAVAMVAHARCPVAVIRGRGPQGAIPAEGPVVVGVDGSPAGEQALELAFEEASLRGVELVATHTWSDVTSDLGYALPGAVAQGWSEAEIQESLVLAERLAGWQAKYPDVQVRREVARDRPAHHLIEQAEQAQLVVVGSRGRGGFAGLLLGSTSQALIHYATCPVLVARPHRTP
jgi:nucleotide-binding universal stress UspA family protein